MDLAGIYHKANILIAQKVGQRQIEHQRQGNTDRDGHRQGKLMLFSISVHLPYLTFDKRLWRYNTHYRVPEAVCQTMGRQRSIAFNEWSANGPLHPNNGPPKQSAGHSIQFGRPQSPTCEIGRAHV